MTDEVRTERAAITYLRCGYCGKQVSTAVPLATVVRAWIQCPECGEKEDKVLRSLRRKQSQ